MQIVKKFAPIAGLCEAIMNYSAVEHTKSDNSVLLYTVQKFSFLLTDDLAGVVGDQIYNTVRGDFFVFSPNEIHFGRFLRAGTHRYLDFYLPTDYFSHGFYSDCLNRTDLAGLFRQSDGTAVNLVHPEENTRADILRITETLAGIAVKHPDEEDHTADLRIFALMLELFEHCAAAYRKQSAYPFSSPVPSVVSKTLRFINENYSENIRLEALSKRFGCSVTYLAKCFRKHTGKTVHKYLTERRIAAAKHLLNTGSTVTEACYGAGFGSCSDFIKVFGKNAGMTPGEYRKKNRAEKTPDVSNEQI